jgi:KaiC/GvpD/RAD55 family RecA-like ATPase
MSLVITKWSALHEPAGVRSCVTLAELGAWLEQRATVDDTGEGFSPVSFDGDYRAKENVELVHMLGLDFDDGDFDCQAWERYRGIAHTTRHHQRVKNGKPACPRWRALLCLSRPVTREEHAQLWLWAAQRGGGTLDRTARDPSRYWFWPPKGSAVVALEGEVLDVDAVLEQVRPSPVVAPVAASSAERADAWRAARGAARESNGGGGASRVRGYLAACCQVIAATPQGERNAAMAKIAYDCGGLSHYGVTLGEMERELLAAARGAGWIDDVPGKTKSTCRRQLEEGAAKPREIGDRDEPRRDGFAVWAVGGEPGASVEEGAAAPPRRASISPAEIVARWADEGPVVRVPTGIAPLDELCDGGLPIPRRVMLVGAPGAGKTAIEIVIADHMARAAGEFGLCVGVLAVDEEPDDVTVRLVQLAGFTLEEAERRDTEVLERMRAELEGLRVRLYDASHTIESAAADLAAWAESEGRRAALMIDSLHAVESDAGAGSRDERARITANVSAMRFVSTHYRMLVVATTEANRASYRNEAAADETNDIAAGAESRAIEFAAQTQLVLRTPKGHPEVIHVRVAKNRRLAKGEFWLTLDRARHALRECPDPSDCPEERAELAEKGRRSVRRGVEADARTVMDVVSRNPGLGDRELRAALRQAGHILGEVRFTAAVRVAEVGVDSRRLVDRRGGDGPSNERRRWHVEHLQEERYE